MPRLQQPEKWKGERGEKQRTAEIHGPPAQPVGKRTKVRDGDELHRRANKHGVQQNTLCHAELLRAIAEHEHGENVEEGVLGKARAHGENHVAAVITQHREDRHLRAGIGSLGFGENGALHDFQPDEHAHAEQQDA